jgi:hypothetical protein
MNVINELEKALRGYFKAKRKAVELSLRAGMEPPKPCEELENLLVGTWKAYRSLIDLQIGVIVHYPERVYVASEHLECAVELLRYMSIPRGRSGRCRSGPRGWRPAARTVTRPSLSACSPWSPLQGASRRKLVPLPVLPADELTTLSELEE